MLLGSLTFSLTALTQSLEPVNKSEDSDSSRAVMMDNCVHIDFGLHIFEV